MIQLKSKFLSLSLSFLLITVILLYKGTQIVFTLI